MLVDHLMLIAVYTQRLFFLSFIDFYLLLVLLFFFFQSLSFSFCYSFYVSVYIAVSVCACVRCIFVFCAFEKQNGFHWLRFAHLLISISISLNFNIDDLPFYVCEFVCVFVYRFVCMSVSERRSASVYYNISNYLTLTKQWNVIYSTRKLQRDLIWDGSASIKRGSRLKIRNTVIFFCYYEENTKVFPV